MMMETLPYPAYLLTTFLCIISEPNKDMGHAGLIGKIPGLTLSNAILILILETRENVHKMKA